MKIFEKKLSKKVHSGSEKSQRQEKWRDDEIHSILAMYIYRFLLSKSLKASFAQYFVENDFTDCTENIFH